MDEMEYTSLVTPWSSSNNTSFNYKQTYAKLKNVSAILRSSILADDKISVNTLCKQCLIRAISSTGVLPKNKQLDINKREKFEKDEPLFFTDLMFKPLDNASFFRNAQWKWNSNKCNVEQCTNAGVLNFSTLIKEQIFVSRDVCMNLNNAIKEDRLTVEFYEIPTFQTGKIDKFFVYNGLNPKDRKNFINIKDVTDAKWECSTVYNPLHGIDETLNPKFNLINFMQKNTAVVNPIGYKSTINTWQPVDIIYSLPRSTSIVLFSTQKWMSKTHDKLTWMLSPEMKADIFAENLSSEKIKFMVGLPALGACNSYGIHNDLKAIVDQKWTFPTLKEIQFDCEPIENLQKSTHEKLNTECITIKWKGQNYEHKLLGIVEMEEDMDVEFENYSINENMDINNASLYKCTEAETKVNNQVSQDNISSIETQPFKYVTKNISEVNYESKSEEMSQQSKTTDCVKSNDSISFGHENNKRKLELSSFDLMIQKKRKSKSNNKMIAIAQYPILDLLNQSTEFRIKNSYSLSSHIKDNINIAPKEQTNDSNAQSLYKENILETTIIEEMPTFPIIDNGKTMNVAINTDFPSRFGAAFIRFERLIEPLDDFSLLEFEISKLKLAFDLFLNPSCGVIFLRPIDIIQIDLTTKNSLIFQNLEPIAHQVISLFFVVVANSSTNFEKNSSLKSFIIKAENCGIKIIKVEDEPNHIACSMMNLISKYSLVSESNIEYDEDYQMLESLEIQNPLLIKWIQDIGGIKYLLEIDEEKRIKLLEDVCSDEVICRINRALGILNCQPQPSN
ncbi:hypothetical protein DAMA08_031450 [Martiniozyma asiatica (nom. inval.)]|nr:hypothetical protein DAMA08_031450 [Martiniozyma asiatica]